MNAAHDRIVIEAERRILPRGFHDPHRARMRSRRCAPFAPPIGRRDPVGTQPRLRDDLNGRQVHRIGGRARERQAEVFQQGRHHGNEPPGAPERLDEIFDQTFALYTERREPPHVVADSSEGAVHGIGLRQHVGVIGRGALGHAVVQDHG